MPTPLLTLNWKFSLCLWIRLGPYLSCEPGDLQVKRSIFSFSQVLLSPFSIPLSLFRHRWGPKEAEMEHRGQISDCSHLVVQGNCHYSVHHFWSPMPCKFADVLGPWAWSIIDLLLSQRQAGIMRKAQTLESGHTCHSTLTSWVALRKLFAFSNCSCLIFKMGLMIFASHGGYEV